MALNKRKVLDAARKYAQKGAKAKALKEYNRLLAEDPRDAKLLLEVGDAYRRWGQNEEAIAQYGKVAQQYRQDGFDARAVAVFKQILNLDPKNYGAYVSLSELYQRMGLDAEAVAALQTAADGYHKEGRKTEALELLRQMAALDPTNTTSRLKVAELLRQEGMEAEALAEYEAVAAELENQQDRDQLVTVLRRILEVAPDRVPTLNALVRNLMAAGDLRAAEPLAVRAKDLSVDAPQFEQLVELYAQMGEDGKLAAITRDFAKFYRDRGDDEKARELMQRLPAEEMASSNSRLAVDVSEVAEPDLGDEELLGDDEPFLTLGEASDDLGASTDLSSFGTGAPVAVESQPVREAPAAQPSAPSRAPKRAPVPEGDPDQLLAEASVYLRYGKTEQAIASLRGVLAQDPDHRAALEKLGEAYAEGGQNAEAIDVWSQAAAQLRSAGEAEALAVLKDRIAALDPAAAARIGDVEAGSATGGVPDLDLGEVGTPSMELDLDLDVEVDLGLDTAIDEVARSETSADLGLAAEEEEFEIELDEDSITFDEPPVVMEPPVAQASAEASIEQTMPELGSEEDGDEDLFEFEIDADEFSLDTGDSDDELEAEPRVELDLDAGDSANEAAPAIEAPAAAAEIRIDEELEEAEFYIAQEMFEEADAILQRILAVVPDHPAALLRSGEVAAARGQEPDAAVSVVDGDASGTSNFESASRFADLTQETLPGISEDASEVGLDLGDEGLDLDLDSEEEVGADRVADEPLPAAEVAADPEPDSQTLTAPAPAPMAMDPGETFDLREALADVIGEEEETAADTYADSAVLSTVEDGFESIFSDFKKGVSATLDDGDFDTRYDLGIAYREMGLYEDAIGEFRFCLDSPDRRFDSLYLMGLCARDLGRFEDSVSHLEQALALPDLPDDRMAGVYFDLSFAEEGTGDLERASASVRRVIELEPGFPGAAERLAALASGGAPGAPGAPEVGAPGEGFESFDDLFDADDDDTQGDHEVVAAAPAETFESFDDVVEEAEIVFDDDDTGEDPKALSQSGRKRISFV